MTGDPRTVPSALDRFLRQYRDGVALGPASAHAVGFGQAVGGEHYVDVELGLHALGGKVLKPQLRELA